MVKQSTEKTQGHIIGQLANQDQRLAVWLQDFAEIGLKKLSVLFYFLL